MLRLFCKLTFWLCLARASLQAQPTALGQTGKASGEAGYLRLGLANDVIQGTDWYYTGGVRLEYAGPECVRMPLRHLLAPLGKDAVHRYGVSLVADAFTPTQIDAAEVLEGDRPYAGYLYAGQFLVSRRPDRKFTLTTCFNVGIMGPPAGMQRAQKGIHQWLDLQKPRGWRNQVATSLLQDYSLQAAHTVLNPIRFLDLTVHAGARAGTLYNQLEAGSTLRVGKLGGYVKKRQPGASPLSRGRYYLLAQSNGNWVSYNATLQGGLVNNRSRYTLRPGQIAHTVLRNTFGAVITFGNVSIEGAQSWVSREFKEGAAHRWNHLVLTLFF
jgi:hypothetical protein